MGGQIKSAFIADTYSQNRSFGWSVGGVGRRTRSSGLRFRKKTSRGMTLESHNLRVIPAVTENAFVRGLSIRPTLCHISQSLKPFTGLPCRFLSVRKLFGRGSIY